MSDAVAGGTGPHYYQELYASPHNEGEIYLADNYMQVSYDGGKTFVRMNETEKHVDNHAVAFKMSDPNYILVGCDGGLYESFDRTKNWKFIDNLPLTQFYKIAVDDAEPFIMSMEEHKTTTLKVHLQELTTYMELETLIGSSFLEETAINLQLSQEILT